MVSTEIVRFLAPRARVLNMIWGAFAVAPLIYVLVSWILTKNIVEPQPSVDVELFKSLFAALALVCAVGSTFFRRWATSERVLQGKLSGAAASAGRATVGSIAGPIDAGPEFANLSEVDQSLARGFVHWQTSLIVVWTLREALAIFGLVLVVLLQEFSVVLPFAGASLALVLLQPPRVQAFLEAAESLARTASISR